jgi:hypothetical protein
LVQDDVELIEGVLPPLHLQIGPREGGARLHRLRREIDRLLTIVGRRLPVGRIELHSAEGDLTHLLDGRLEECHDLIGRLLDVPPPDGLFLGREGLHPRNGHELGGVSDVVSGLRVLPAQNHPHLILDLHGELLRQYAVQIPEASVVLLRRIIDVVVGHRHVGREVDAIAKLLGQVLTEVVVRTPLGSEVHDHDAHPAAGLLCLRLLRHRRKGEKGAHEERERHPQASNLEHVPHSCLSFHGLCYRAPTSYSVPSRGRKGSPGPV